jgi:serine/threonine-protein kinase HipA
MPQTQAPDGSLWIAKFPSGRDEWNSGAWEIVTHDLAAMYGLDTVNAILEKFSNLSGTYLSKRFDRNGTRRIHFSSAMTLLGKTDGDGGGAEGVSYLDLASFNKSNSASPKHDLEEFWKRIVFNITVISPFFIFVA